MRVKFKHGYMGRETREQWVEPGVIIEIDDSERHLIDNGLAIEVLDDIETSSTELDVKKPRGRKRKVSNDGIDEKEN